MRDHCPPKAGLFARKWSNNTNSSDNNKQKLWSQCDSFGDPLWAASGSYTRTPGGIPWAAFARVYMGEIIHKVWDVFGVGADKEVYKLIRFKKFGTSLR